MKLIYTLGFYLALPFILLRLWWKGLKNPAYRARWQERLGFFHVPKIQHGLWVHAVSVGEVIAAIPLIKALKSRYPHKQIIVTTMTPTGSARVQAAFGEDVFHVYIPYDFPGAIHRFIKRVRPCVVVIMETELWPNLIPTCGKHHIPVIIANARLSERSARGYKKIKPLMTKVLHPISQVAAQTATDGMRFLQIGLTKEQLTIAGNIKFDLAIPENLSEQASLLRAQWGENRPVWIAASTHEGEDEIILAAFAKLRVQVPSVLLILVPRHPERFNKVLALCRKQNVQTAQRSMINSWNTQTDILVGDTMGELLLLYAASDIAFVGGSLVAVGGHNLLEPAALGLPVLTGPYMHHFTEINQLLHTAKAAITVMQATDLAQQVLAWLQDESARKRAGEQGRQVVIDNRGALERHLELIAKYIEVYVL